MKIYYNYNDNYYYYLTTLNYWFPWSHSYNIACWNQTPKPLRKFTFPSLFFSSL